MNEIVCVRERRSGMIITDMLLVLCTFSLWCTILENESVYSVNDPAGLQDQFKLNFDSIAGFFQSVVL